MTNSEYQELVEFLGRKFEEIDRRFDAVQAKLVEHDGRFEAVQAKLVEHDARFDAIDERFRDVLGHFDNLKWPDSRVGSRNWSAACDERWDAGGKDCHFK